jgi:hypothetical protein
MYKTTDVLSLGTEYTVADRNGNVIKTIQVIPHTEILEAAQGAFDLEKHGSITEYLEKSIAAFTGFEGINPSKVLWYSTLEEEIVLSEIIEFAIHNGYDKIILEHLDGPDDMC